MECTSHEVLRSTDKPCVVGPDNYGVKVDIRFAVNSDSDGNLDEAEYQDFLRQLKEGMARIAFVGKQEDAGIRAVSVAMIFEDFAARRKRGWLSPRVRKLLGLGD